MLGFLILLINLKLNTLLPYSIFLGLTSLKTPFVMEPHRKGLYRRAPCSRVHFAYSLYQLRVGISPPYALDPYD